MERIKSFFVKDIGWKILSILLAVGLWFVVINIENPVESRKYTVPLTIENKDYLSGKNLVVSNMDIMAAARVIVGIKGERLSLDSLSSSRADIIAAVDLTEADISLDDGYADVPVAITLPTYKGSTVEIISVSLQKARFQIERYVSADFPVTIRINGEAGEGFVLDTPAANPELVTVSGAESKVKRVQSVNAYVDASAVTSDMRVEAALMAADGEGNAVPDVYLNHGGAEITIPVKSSKSVPVSQEISGELPPGYAVAEIRITPETVRIMGDGDAVADFAELRLPEGDIMGLTETKEEVYLVRELLPTGVSPVNSAEIVTVRISIREVTEKTFTIPAENIIITGQPEAGCEARLYTREITAILSGYKEDMEIIDEKDIKASLDVNGLSRGSHENPVDFQVPEGIKVEGEGEISVIFSIVKTDAEENTG